MIVDLDKKSRANCQPFDIKTKQLTLSRKTTKDTIQRVQEQADMLDEYDFAGGERGKYAAKCKKDKVLNREVAINKCYGGFSLSAEALLWLWERGCQEIGTPVKQYYGGEGKYAELHHDHDWKQNYQQDLKTWHKYLENKKDSVFLSVFSPCEKFALSGEPDRSDPLLIECIKTLGDKANGRCAEIEIIEIPANVEYEIEEYDGMEHIAEKHRTWN